MDDTIDLLKIKIEKAKAALPTETVNAIAAVDWEAAISGLREKKGYNFEQLGDLELETELSLCGLLSPADYPKELENRMQISKAEANELVNEMNDLVFKKIKEELIKNTERKKIFTNEEPSLEAPEETPKETKETSTSASDRQILKSAGIEMVEPNSLNRNTDINPRTAPKNQKEIPKEIETVRFSPSKTPEAGEVHPMLKQKFSETFQIPMVKTDHSLDNISKVSTPEKEIKATPRVDLPPGPTSVKDENEVKTPVPKAPTVYPKDGDPYRLSPNG